MTVLASRQYGEEAIEVVKGGLRRGRELALERHVHSTEGGERRRNVKAAIGVGEFDVDKRHACGPQSGCEVSDALRLHDAVGSALNEECGRRLRCDVRLNLGEVICMGHVLWHAAHHVEHHLFERYRTHRHMRFRVRQRYLSRLRGRPSVFILPIS